MPERGVRNAVTMCSAAPNERASSAAAWTALSAVGEPSVPTTSVLYIASSLFPPEASAYPGSDPRLPASPLNRPSAP